MDTIRKYAALLVGFYSIATDLTAFEDKKTLPRSLKQAYKDWVDIFKDDYLHIHRII